MLSQGLKKIAQSQMDTGHYAPLLWSSGTASFDQTLDLSKDREVPTQDVYRILPYCLCLEGE
jgi:hypothetical protein